MDRIDRLIEKARPKLTKVERLFMDNPYMGMNFRDMLDIMGKAGTVAEKIGTWEHDQFNAALLDAYCRYQREPERIRIREHWQRKTENVKAEEPAEELKQEQGPDPMEAFNRLYYKQRYNDGTD